MNRFHRWYCRSGHWRLRDLDLGDEVLENGPGPGLTTDRIRQQVARLTAMEIDPALAAKLNDRLAGPTSPSRWPAGRTASSSRTIRLPGSWAWAGRRAGTV